jgi:hypothetical protein
LEDIDPVLQVPALERALSRASVTEIDPRGYVSTLFHLFGLNPNTSNDLPTAPYCRLADSLQKDNEYWVQASPVHLQPDGKSLLLFDVAHLEPSLDEAEQLAALVQEHFSSYGWRLEVHDPQRWYLRLETEPDLQTYPLIDVIGRNIDHFLPKGKDAVNWHSIMNELQMLLHTSKVNILREGRGQLSINGLWLHGGGVFQPIEQSVYTAASGDEPLLQGMALAAGIEVMALPQESADIAAIQEQLLVVDHRLQRSVLDANHNAWIGAVDSFVGWFNPFIGAVQSGRLGYVNIYPCNGSVYRIDAKSMRRFWRRKIPLSRFISG